MLSVHDSDFDDAVLLQSMARGDDRAFDLLYKRYSNAIISFVYSRLNDREKAKEIVQDVFLSLWEKRSTATISTLRSYLYTSAKFKIINTVRDEKLHSRYVESFFAINPHRLQDNSNQEHQGLKDLENSIEKSLRELPERYSKAFRLSRMEHLPISEVAKRMNISKQAVENYISHTLKHLRGSLGEFMFLVVWLEMWE